MNLRVCFMHKLFTCASLVEPRGIEPLSENPSSRLSPSAVYLLEFPRSDADKQASLIGSL